MTDTNRDRQQEEKKFRFFELSPEATERRKKHKNRLQKKHPPSCRREEERHNDDFIDSVVKAMEIR